MKRPLFENTNNPIQRTLITSYSIPSLFFDSTAKPQTLSWSGRDFDTLSFSKHLLAHAMNFGHSGSILKLPNFSNTENQE